ncbi:hypothetical protein D3C87_1638330 [compost metagenome]
MAGGREARQGEHAGVLHGRVEGQAQRRDGDDHQQDAARHAAALQAEDRRQPEHRHHHREGGDVAQLHGQAGAGVLDHQADLVRGNQQ